MSEYITGKDDFAGQSEVVVVEVMLPGIHKIARFRSMNGREYIRCLRLAQKQPEYLHHYKVLLTLVDPQDRRIFADGDLDELLELDSKLVDALCDAANSVVTNTMPIERMQALAKKNCEDQAADGT